MTSSTGTSAESTITKNSKFRSLFYALPVLLLIFLCILTLPTVSNYDPTQLNVLWEGARLKICRTHPDSAGCNDCKKYGRGSDLCDSCERADLDKRDTMIDVFTNFTCLGTPTTTTPASGTSRAVIDPRFDPPSIKEVLSERVFYKWSKIIGDKSNRSGMLYQTCLSAPDSVGCQSCRSADYNSDEPLIRQLVRLSKDKASDTKLAICDRCEALYAEGSPVLDPTNTFFNENCKQ